MALAALHRRVFVCQRKTRRAVIEFSVGPSRDWMARRARRGARRETCCHVIRNISTDCCRTLPRRLVAPHTICRIERVIPADVARRTRSWRRRKVGSYECEASRAVVELAGGPRRDRMARRACCGTRRKASRHVIRNISADCCRALPRRLVTPHTIS